MPGESARTMMRVGVRDLLRCTPSMYSTEGDRPLRERARRTDTTCGDGTLGATDAMTCGAARIGWMVMGCWLGITGGTRTVGDGDLRRY